MNFEDLLVRDGILTYKTRGISMEPMLRENRDLVNLRRKMPDERCCENDVVLYKYPGKGKYILHRIVEVREHDYVILGDNCISYEYGITDADILGVMVSFNRNGKHVEADDPEYLSYVKKIRSNEKRRILQKKIKLCIKSAARKLFRKLIPKMK